MLFLSRVHARRCAQWYRAGDVSAAPRGGVDREGSADRGKAVEHVSHAPHRPTGGRVDPLPLSATSKASRRPPERDRDLYSGGGGCVLVGVLQRLQAAEVHRPLDRGAVPGRRLRPSRRGDRRRRDGFAECFTGPKPRGRMGDSVGDRPHLVDCRWTSAPSLFSSSAVSAADRLSVRPPLELYPQRDQPLLGAVVEVALNLFRVWSALPPRAPGSRASDVRGSTLRLQAMIFQAQCCVRPDRVDKRCFPLRASS